MWLIVVNNTPGCIFGRHSFVRRRQFLNSLYNFVAYCNMNFFKNTVVNTLLIYIINKANINLNN